MNKFFKKIAVVLAMTIVFAAMPMSVFAEEATTPVEVGTYEELLTALETANANVVMTQDITGAAAANSGYGVAGIVLEAGDVLDGNGHKLTVNGANTTWDCAVAMRGGEVKNLTIAGAMRGVFMPGANGNVVIDGCVFENVIYTFNSDAGSKDYSVTIKNTTLNGWTSFSDVHKSVTFENCNFGEGSGYAFCRPYQATTFTNCNFAEGFAVDTRITEANALVFNGCKYNNVALSAENNDMFIYGGSVVIDNNSTDVNHYVAKVGETPFMILQEAINNANGGTVTLLDNIDLPTAIVVTSDVKVDLAGKTITLKEDTVGDGAFHVTGGTLTIDDSVGGAVVNGVGNNNYSMALWADGGNIVINGGTYTNVGAGSDDHYDLIYAKNGGVVEIYGGTFKAHTPKWTLNQNDSTNGKITVYGGTFVGVNPSEVYTEPTQPISFVAAGYESKAVGTDYVVGKHELKAVSGVSATCSATGTKAHEKCDFCGKLYINGVEVTAADLVAPSTGHTWGYNTTFDAAEHWDYCHVCGAQNTSVAHSDADGNGLCDCGWNFAVTTGRANPNTGVTADMLA